MEELVSETMGEIQILSKQIGLMIKRWIKGEGGPKIFIVFKGSLTFFKNIKYGYITQEKTEEDQIKLKQI